jgi:hypothetical protein
MRRLILSTLIVAGLVSLGGINSFATIQQSTIKVAAISSVKGKVTAIKNDSNLLKIQDEAGKTYSFTVTDSKALQGLKVEDMVRVTMKEGKATSIQKVESAPSKNGSEGESSNY